MANRTAGTKKAGAPASIQNRRARHDYAIVEEFETGIALAGSEVKSVYLGKAHFTDAYCRVIDGELWLLNMDIEPYEQSSVFQHDRRRDRKLLMHRRQIDTLDRKAQEKGMTIIPLAAYFNERGRVKIKIGLGRGRAQYDKRDKIAKDEERREMQRIRADRD